jgi:outer membrane receptor for ferrienterochelin and colicin
VGIVQKLTKSLNLKFLYSTAYRSPTIKDVGINAESAKDMIDSSKIDDISPESLTSLEIGISYNTDKVSLNTTFFSNETKDALNGKQITDSDSKKYNVVQNSLGKTISKGVEFELKALLTKRFTLTLNYSMADSEAIDEDDNVTGLADVATARYNIILSYKVKNSTYSFISRNVEGYTAENRDRIVSGYHVYDFHIRGRLNKMYSTQLSILNIADEEVRLPLGGNKYMPVDRRKFYASLSYHY